MSCDFQLRGQNGLTNSMSSITTGTNQEWETNTEDLENDESFSQPIECTLTMNHPGKNQMHSDMTLTRLILT